MGALPPYPRFFSLRKEAKDLIIENPRGTLKTVSATIIPAILSYPSAAPPSGFVSGFPTHLIHAL